MDNDELKAIITNTNSPFTLKAMALGVLLASRLLPGDLWRFMG